MLDGGVECWPPSDRLMTENYSFPPANFDESTERNRNKVIKYWERDKLFEALALDEMEQDMTEELGEEGAKQLRIKVEEEAWAFRGIFFSGNWEEYKEPLRIPPIKLQTMETMPSVICKYRKISPEKEKVLKEMIEKMVKGGIIGKSDGRGRCVSNPHVIMEEKIENGITSIRPQVTQDFRAVNECLLSESYKLKNIDAVLQKVTDHVVDTIEDTACGFIDDFILYNLCYLTAFDTLRKFLIIASHFNVKLMPQNVNG